MRRSVFFFLLGFLVFMVVVSVESRSLESSTQPSAYELLESFGFPTGLLPHTVVDYSLQSNGKFVLRLNSTCSAMLQSTYLVSYHPTISGSVRYRSIKSLKGVSVRAFYLDWGISGIRVRDKDVVFDVGMGSTKFALSNFDESPQCQVEHTAM